MDIAAIILDYLRVLFSWPVVTGVIAISAICLFKSDIKLLMSRIAKIRFPGGSELSTSQLERTKEEKTESERPEVPQVEANQPVPLPADLEFTQQQLEAVRQLYLNERANAYLWEYRYLNYFLAYQTQQVLDWLVPMSAPISRSLFDNIWTPYIPIVQERDAIINALQAHYLIGMDSGLISVTPKGQEYHQWRGPLPQREAT
ncbi:MAG: hypothetical protein GC164_11515 [Phycisphaera sp.]|nr:hypothetical protein [Phycisphaera sp.]